MSRKNRMPLVTANGQPLVSIIIPNYRRFDLLAKCLASIPAAFGVIP